MESGDDGLESEANVRPRPRLTGAGSPGAQSTATDRGPSQAPRAQARLNRSAKGAGTACSARHTCPKTPETQSRNGSVRQAARGIGLVGRTGAPVTDAIARPPFASPVARVSRETAVPSLELAHMLDAAET